MDVGVLLDLGYPVSDGLEGPAVGDVIHQEDALRAAEVGRGDGAESLLSGCVPDLELDALTIHFHIFDLEINADGGNKSGGEGVVGVTQEEAGLTNAGVTDHEQLALHVVGGGVGHGAIVYTFRFLVYSAPLGNCTSCWGLRMIGLTNNKLKQEAQQRGLLVLFLRCTTTGRGDKRAGGGRLPLWGGGEKEASVCATSCATALQIPTFNITMCFWFP